MSLLKKISSVFVVAACVATVASCAQPVPPAAPNRWRCVASDRAGKTWYWVAPNKEVAINNARRACRRHSAVGGCSVPVGSCSAH